jgi:hypothetical protein
MSMTINPGTFEYILSGPPSRYLAAGDSGSVALRDGLASLGFTQDSLEDAVRAFQLKHNAEHPERPIKVDGKAGIQTLNALYGAPASGGVQDIEGKAQFLRAKSAALTMLGDPPAGAVRLKTTTPDGIKQELGEALDRGKPAPKSSFRVVDVNGRPLQERTGDRIILNTTPGDGEIMPGVYDVNGQPMRERTGDRVILNTKPRDGEIMPGVYDVNGHPMRERTGDTIIK